MSAIRQIDPSIDPRQLSDEELLLAHMTTHAYYKEFRQGREKEGWTLKEVVQAHDDIRMEIERRDDVEHEYVNALDSESVNIEQGLEIQMGHTDSVAKEWVDDLLQADDVDQHIRENPPDADWYPKAVEFVQEEDGSLDLEEYVDFAAQSYDTLDEPIQEWIQEATNSEVGAVGYYFNEDTETGVLFVKQSDEYEVYVDSILLNSTDKQAEALETYNEASRSVQDGARAVDVTDEDTWQISSDGEYLATNGEDNWGRLREDSKLLRENIQGLRVKNAEGDTPVPANYRDEVATTLNQFEVAQGEVVDTSEDHRWYVWSGEREAKGWMNDHDFSAGSSDRDGDFLAIANSDAQDDYDEFRREWQGNASAPSGASEGDDISPGEDEDDPRPVLFQWGVDQGEAVEVASLWFPVEAPGEEQGITEVDATFTFEQGELIDAEFHDDLPGTIFQAEFDDDAEKDWYWYQWDRPEINVWAKERDLDIGVGDANGQFLSVEVNNADRYEEFQTVWEGRRSKPGQERLPGGDKPRRVTYGVTQDGEREIQKIDFLTGEIHDQVRDVFFDD